MMINRAAFSKDLEPIRKQLRELIAELEKPNPDWYGSVYFERKSVESYAADFRKTHVQDRVSMGAVLRLYDGYTLFEQATDDLEPNSLQKSARTLIQRALDAQALHTGKTKRVYKPATWSQRLNPAMGSLEPEITSQIPKGVGKDTPVHFGIRYQQDPLARTPEQRLQSLKQRVEQFKALAPEHDLRSEDITYATAREDFSLEESIFIDRESNLSQTLYRLSLTLVVMSGQDRTIARVGGLGGVETIQLKDEEFCELLVDLKGLKNAERLAPGKYRVLFAPALSGVLAHEAFGHSQEGDTCARKRSKAWDLWQTGESAGNEHATILNNPAIFDNGKDSYAAWGSYFFDEEGWLAQEQVLLDHGRLLKPMTHLTSAIQLEVPRTANGKRQDWSHGVYTRQTNTYFSAGKSTLDELMSQVSYGFLAAHTAGGMEDPKGMGIQVGVAYLREIKNGQFTGRYFKGPAGGDIQLTGYTPDVLNSIIGKTKIEYDTRSPDHARHPVNDVGGCGKYHKEFVVAGCGGPYMLLDQVTLG